MLEKNNAKMVEEIKDVIVSSRTKVAYEVNNTMLLAYWNVGRIIVENEQNGNIKAEYGKQVLKELSKELRKVLGTGFSVSNLFNMRKLYITYPKFQTLSGKYGCGIISIEQDLQPTFFEMLIEYYENGDMTKLKKWIYENCIDGIELDN